MPRKAGDKKMMGPTEFSREADAVIRNVLVVGASGGIGSALIAALQSRRGVEHLFAAGRSPVESSSEHVEQISIDLTDEASIAAMAQRCRRVESLDLIIVATGVLHDGDLIQPEKRLAELSRRQLELAFAINCTGPALVAKHCVPLLTRDRRSVFAALSARVGSIGDNRYGGWYSYRASKAALNMFVRTLALELARRNPRAICLALHPGTVDTPLSKPFQARVPPARLFTPERAAQQLLDVITAAGPEQSGDMLAWDGSTVPP
jgi:NAD(P)-dependent dehydrogenase (short-subunit alcohol dehydrogenase family)